MYAHYLPAHNKTIKLTQTVYRTLSIVQIPERYEIDVLCLLYNEIVFFYSIHYCFSVFITVLCFTSLCLVTLMTKQFPLSFRKQVSRYFSVE